LNRLKRGPIAGFQTVTQLDLVGAFIFQTLSKRTLEMVRLLHDSPFFKLKLIESFLGLCSALLF
jgi:hypothetical protein